MAAVFRQSMTVPPEAVDINGHVNNVVYLQWMQDAAVRHARAVGSVDATRAAGGTWVVRSHHVDYLRPAYAGERIEVLTWVADLQRRRSRRRYKFLRAEDGRTLVVGETLWVFVDALSARPRDIPDAVRACFEVVPEDEEP